MGESRARQALRPGTAAHPRPPCFVELAPGLPREETGPTSRSASRSRPVAAKLE